MKKHLISVFLILFFANFAFSHYSSYSSVSAQDDSYNFKMIAAGSNFSAALKNDGTVWVWGTIKKSNQLAGQYGYKMKPQKVEGLDNIISITAGRNFLVSLKEDGTVWLWGSQDGILSADNIWNDNISDLKIPEQIKEFSDIKAVYAAINCTRILAVKKNGTVWAMGDNTYKQIGDGTISNNYAPFKINNLEDVKEVAMAYNYNLALKNDGTVWAWGVNGGGFLGNGTNNSSTTPVKIEAIDNVKAIRTSRYGILALNNDGTLWTWGSNSFVYKKIAQFNEKPVEIPGIDKITEFFDTNETKFIDVIKDSGEIYGITRTIGVQTELFNDSDENLGFSYSSVTSLLSQSSLKEFKSMFYGTGHITGLKKDGTVWVNGGNKFGQLGNDTNITNSKFIPVNFSEYSSTENTTAKSVSSKISVIINNNYIKFDTQPFIENDRILVPIRMVIEPLGGTIDWYAETQTVVNKGWNID